MCNPLKQGTCTSLLSRSDGTFLASHAFDLVAIKRSWHSTKDGSEIVGVESVSVTKWIPSMHRVNVTSMNIIKVGKKKMLFEKMTERQDSA